VGILSVAGMAGGLTACSHSPASRSPPEGSPAVVRVTKVTDGDTIHVDYLGQDDRVRLIGVDTPEVSWYGGRGECYGEEAGQYSRSRLDGRTVRLEFDVDPRDRYGRLLAYVFLGDELFNLTLVRLGYATADPVRPDTARAAEFAAAEQSARMAGKGLWSACPTTPA
jgi:micrococcal nuclease